MARKKQQRPETRAFEVRMRIVRECTVTVQAVDASDAKAKAEAFDIEHESPGECVDWEVLGEPCPVDE